MRLEQSDGTSWMAMYTLNLFAIALELANDDPVYADIASKFWEHFLYIAHAMSDREESSLGLWDPEDGFFYDVLQTRDGWRIPVKVRSMVGLIPLFAVETLEPAKLARMPEFNRRMQWFLAHRPDLTGNVASMEAPGLGERRLLLDCRPRSVAPHPHQDARRERVPLAVRDPRPVTRPPRSTYVLNLDGQEYSVGYEAAESNTGLFGGNSNWRGPVWFPVNYLLIESLQKFHHYFGDEFQVECPTGSGQMMDLWEVAAELSRRLSSIFLQQDGRRAVYGGSERFQTDPHWRDLVLFYEYFHGDTGEGLGASHQTGWTAIVAKLLQQSGEPHKEHP